MFAVLKDLQSDSIKRSILSRMCALDLGVLYFSYSIGASTATFGFCSENICSFYHFSNITMVNVLTMSRFGSLRSKNPFWQFSVIASQLCLMKLVAA